MPKQRRLYIIAGIVSTFTLLAGVVILLVLSRSISPEFGVLALVALLGIYIGFGVLYAVYHLTGKLE